MQSADSESLISLSYCRGKKKKKKHKVCKDLQAQVKVKGSHAHSPQSQEDRTVGRVFVRLLADECMCVCACVCSSVGLLLTKSATATLQVSRWSCASLPTGFSPVHQRHFVSGSGLARLSLSLETSCGRSAGVGQVADHFLPLKRAPAISRLNQSLKEQLDPLPQSGSR